MIDVNKTVRTFLLAQSGITDLVGSRIYMLGLPESAVYPNLQLISDGGISNVMTPRVSPQFAVFSWGSNIAQAVELNGVVYDSLTSQNNDRHGHSIDRITNLTLSYPYEGTEDSGWRAMLSYWNFEIFND